MLKKLTAAVAVAATAMTFSVDKAKAVGVDVDLMFVIDRSGSMSGEFNFLGSAIGDFLTFLSGDSRINSVEAGLVTYLGSPTLNQALTNNATTLANAFNGVSTSGATENAYRAVDFGLDELINNGRAGSTKSIILITDEDADDFSAATRTALAAKLDANGILNNIIYNFAGTDSNGFGNASDDFDPIARPNGAIFDINLFRDNRDEFFADFANAKLREIVTPTIPLPAGLPLLLGGLVVLGGLGAARRRSAAA